MRLIVNVALICKQMREREGRVRCASNKPKKIVFCLAIVTWALTKRALAGDGVGSIIPPAKHLARARGPFFIVESFIQIRPFAIKVIWPERVIESSLGAVY
jgi:hypothetical protein